MSKDRNNNRPEKPTVSVRLDGQQRVIDAGRLSVEELRRQLGVPDDYHLARALPSGLPVLLLKGDYTLQLRENAELRTILIQHPPERATRRP